MGEKVGFTAYTYRDGKGIFHLFPGLCKGCGLCIEKCPVNTIGWSSKLGFMGTPAVEPGHGRPCIACRNCELVCPDCAIQIEKAAGEDKSGNKRTSGADMSGPVRH